MNPNMTSNMTLFDKYSNLLCELTYEEREYDTVMTGHYIEMLEVFANNNRKQEFLRCILYLQQNKIITQIMTELFENYLTKLTEEEEASSGLLKESYYSLLCHYYKVCYMEKEKEEKTKNTRVGFIKLIRNTFDDMVKSEKESVSGLGFEHHFHSAGNPHYHYQQYAFICKTLDICVLEAYVRYCFNYFFEATCNPDTLEITLTCEKYDINDNTSKNKEQKHCMFIKYHCMWCISRLAKGEGYSGFVKASNYLWDNECNSYRASILKQIQKEAMLKYEYKWDIVLFEDTPISYTVSKSCKINITVTKNKYGSPIGAIVGEFA